ncbi:MAG: Transaldolase [Parcubacteria group bacterium Gr01-1014_19]|nr:MAG: Transaldolase [Parcubacteria group bacterium Gr01-1014_19]
MPIKIHNLKIKIFADGAEKDGMIELAKKPYIQGFTTNPTLMRKAGITDYVKFAKEVVAAIPDKPISFEVFSDDFKEMERQAKIISSWGKNVYVKIPITNTKRESAVPLIAKLVSAGIKVNVTAVFTVKQVEEVAKVLSKKIPSVVSVFAGRIADAGYDPKHYMKKAKAILDSNPKAELLWASPRELWNVYQAHKVGCDIITVPHDILKKMEKLGYDLDEFSLDTVKMFYEDGQKVGYTLYES